MPAKHEILKDLKTERLILKPISTKYKEEIYNHFSDPDVTKYMDIDVLESLAKAEEIINYDLSKRYWKKGFMSKAVTRLIKHGFKALKLH